MSTSTLFPMGVGEPETFRCRIYGGEDDAERTAFLEQLAGEGAIDCPAIDPWVEALQARGWLANTPALEPNPDGPGRIGRWNLTDKGRAEWAQIRGAR